MANLTREQRAEREAAKAQEEAVDDGLVEMTKDGETTRVHPTCIKSHIEAHWKVKEAA